MKGDKITYGLSIERPGRWERLDYETTVQGGESLEQAHKRAKHFVENSLNLYQEQGIEIRMPSIAGPHYQEKRFWPNEQQIPSSQETETDLTPPQKIIQQLQKCTSINDPNTGLKTWELIVQKNEKQYPEVRVEFDKLLSQLHENQ